MRGKFLATTVTVALAAVLVGCGSEQSGNAPDATTTRTMADNIPRISPIPIPVPSDMTTPSPAAAAGCDEAPARLVELIDAGFTDGQHLEDVQALDGRRASTYIAGNIYTAEGVRDSSHNAWLYVNGEIYALTKDARRDTLFTDGRDLIPEDFFSSDDWSDLGECINAAARAAGK